MIKNIKPSFLFFIAAILIVLLLMLVGVERSRFKAKLQKKETCSYYIGYSQKFLDLYIKRNESSELLEYISTNQSINPDISLLNVYLAKRASIERDYSNIITDVAGICIEGKNGEFLLNIFNLLKLGDIRKTL